jgi:FkbM family methyltransferase
MTGDHTVRLLEVDTIFGRMWTFDNDLITNQIFQFGAHTRPELAFLLSVVRPGDLVFDLGGHIGTFAMPLAAKIGGAGKLLVVEGKPENYAVLRRNMPDGRAPAETTLLNALVARADQRYQAHTPEKNTGGTWFLPAEDDAPTIETVTIDELCDRYFTPRVMKIDIEGWELFALAGCDLIARDHPIVYAEINEPLLGQQGASIDDLDRVFRGAGYRLFRNIGDRNAAHDRFVVTELAGLAKGGRFFDVLAVHETDDRLGDLVRCAVER